MTIIDCNTCPVRGQRCSTCFVPVVAGAWLSDDIAETATATLPPDARSLSLRDAEWDAVDVFIGAGMVNALDVLDLVAHPETTSVPRWLQVG